MDVAIIIEQVIIGIVLGSQYAMIAIGMALIYGVMHVTNVAHGEFMAIGGYVAVAVGAALFSTPLLVIPVAAVAVGIFGMGVDRFLLRPLRRENRMVERSVIVLTLGLSILLANAVHLVWGPGYYKGEPLVSGTTQLGVMRLPNQRLAVGVIGLICIGGVFYLVRRTKFGLAMRAVTQNVDSAKALGINTNQIYLLTFGVAAALAAIAGPLVSPELWLWPTMGFRFTVKAIIIIIIGGMGSLWGALVGALILGVSESLAVLWMGAQFRDVLGMLLMIVVLLIRPQGILGQATHVD